MWRQMMEFSEVYPGQFLRVHSPGVSRHEDVYTYYFVEEVDRSRVRWRNMVNFNICWFKPREISWLDRAEPCTEEEVFRDAEAWVRNCSENISAARSEIRRDKKNRKLLRQRMRSIRGKAKCRLKKREATRRSV